MNIFSADCGANSNEWMVRFLWIILINFTRLLDLGLDFNQYKMDFWR